MLNVSLIRFFIPLFLLVFRLSNPSHVLLATLTGGLTAVFFTDVLQCCIMIVGGIVVAIMSKLNYRNSSFVLFYCRHPLVFSQKMYTVKCKLFKTRMLL